jgi:hypothetical protein
MGCWDVYCIICGNPCHGMFKNFAQSIKEEYIDPEIKSSFTNLYKAKMKRLQESKIIVQELEKFSKHTQWMFNCSMLMIDNNVIHGLKEQSCNIDFGKAGFSATHIGKYTSEGEYSFKELGIYGIFIHTDCWKFIKQTYNVDLKFGDLPRLENNSRYKIFDIDYGQIEKYWQQEFEFEEVVVDKKQYLCSSPLKHDKNIPQIKKNIAQLKIKNDSKRVGPSSSATFFDEGTIKIGNNKKFWIKNNNKWVQMNDTMVIIKIEVDLNKINRKTEKFLVNIPFIGMYNTNPIFIKSSVYNRNKYQLEIITTESYKSVLLNLL